MIYIVVCSHLFYVLRDVKLCTIRADRGNFGHAHNGTTNWLTVNISPEEHEL